MYAVVKTGGKQYKVSPGERLIVEKIPGDPGQEVILSEVLLVKKGEEIKIGQPVLSDTQVVATILEQGRSKKIIVFKKKRRKNYRRKKGHRQPYTIIEIKEIKV